MSLLNRVGQHLNHIVYETILPVCKQKVKFRPFLVKEQKHLLIAKESNDIHVISKATIDLIEACIIDAGTITFGTLHPVDIEHLFLQIRIPSVGEYSNIAQKLSKCKPTCEPVQIQIDLRDVKANCPWDGKPLAVKLSDTLALKMRYPSYEFIQTLPSINMDDGITVEDRFKLIAYCIDTIYAGEDTIPASTATSDEIMDFIDALSSAQFEAIQEFFDNMPSLSYTTECKCPMCGNSETLVLSGIQSFFM